MNNGIGEIEIIKPFGEAFDLMKKVLFEPFDLKKWFVIGFAAWLSHIGSGGLNFNYRTGRSDLSHDPTLRSLVDAIHRIPLWLLVSGISALFIFIVALALVFAWLRARGRFMFTDCVVHNRAAVVEPWREFRPQGNSYFIFAVVVGCIVFVIAGAASLPFMLPIVRGVTFLHLHDVYLFSMIALWAMLLFLLIFAWSLITHFMVVIMYRSRCLAMEAFSLALRLIWDYPGEVTLYCLFWIALAIGTAVLSCAAILATCCLAILPYLGTVILLPVFVCLRGFGLYFIRQFGADYDVWATIPQSIPPPLPS